MPIEQLVVFRPDLQPIDSFPMTYHLVREQYHFRAIHPPDRYASHFIDSDQLKKIVYFEYWNDSLLDLPKEKLVLFKWEAVKIDPLIYERFSTVYTIDDELVDNEKFFKFFYPALQPMLSNRTPFPKKKLCTMVVTNWTEERCQILDFFNEKKRGEFEFYGHPAFPHFLSPMYQGKIEGYHSGLAKIRTLDEYRFGICFENTHTTPGYVTEKIFNYFAAGTIPIYWGPENIEEYIPKHCFIDYRDFSSLEELYQFIVKMDEDTYHQYIVNIQDYLDSDLAQLFSPERFEHILLEAIER
jgi:hypothetical protein